MKYIQFLAVVTLAVVTLAVASACSTQKYYWAHPEKDSQQFSEDNSYCVAKSRGAKALAKLPQYHGGQAGEFSSGWDTVPAIEVAETQKTIQRQCMIDKGWRLEAE